MQDSSIRFTDYIKDHKVRFKEQLFSFSDEFNQTIDQNLLINREHLVDTVHQVISFIQSEKETELFELATKRGQIWAESNLPITIKLNFFSNFRRIYWNFLQEFYEEQDKTDFSCFFDFENKINHKFDLFVNSLVQTYTDYKNETIQRQRETIEELTTPIISLTDKMAILPLIGILDTYRAKEIQENSLKQVEQERIDTLIIDLSGIEYIDTAVLNHLFKLTEGVKILGCKSILTGIRSEIANSIVALGIDIGKNTEIYGSLKQAMEQFIVHA